MSVPFPKLTKVTNSEALFTQRFSEHGSGIHDGIDDTGIHQDAPAFINEGSRIFCCISALVAAGQRLLQRIMVMSQGLGSRGGSHFVPGRRLRIQLFGPVDWSHDITYVKDCSSGLEGGGSAHTSEQASGTQYHSTDTVEMLGSC